MNTSAILWQYFLTKHSRRFKNRHQLLDWQHHKVINFLKTIVPQSPFYRERYQGLDIQNWQQFPLTDKAAMMENFDVLNTVGIKKADAFALTMAAEETRNFSTMLQGHTVGLSSGTSGNRGLFIVSPQEQQTWAGTILAKALPQSIFAPQRIAFFLRSNSNLYQTVRRQRIRFEYFDLFDALESHIHRLNHLAPTILVAPPSMLRFLGIARSRGELTISPIKIISVAEVLDPLDEQYIQRCFGQIVHQLYQCTEGFLGSTCTYGTLHLNEDIVVIQKDYLDRSTGKFAPIITDFNRQAQPIIRYRLDDILTERQTPCPCGSVLTALESVEGRCDDIFWVPDDAGQKLVPIFPDFIRRAIILAAAEIQEYRVVQKQLDLIEVFLQTPSASQSLVQQQVSQSLTDLFTRSHCQVPHIRHQNYVMQTDYHLKLRRVQRDFES